MAPAMRSFLLVLSLGLVSVVSGCAAPELKTGPETEPEAWSDHFVWNVPDGIHDFAVIVDLAFRPGHECHVNMEFWGRTEDGDGANAFGYTVDATGNQSFGSAQRLQMARAVAGPVQHQQMFGRSTWFSGFNGTSHWKGEGLASIDAYHGYDRAMMREWHPDEETERNNIDITCKHASVRATVELTEEVTRFQSSGETDGLGIAAYPSTNVNAELNVRNSWAQATRSGHTFVGFGTLPTGSEGASHQTGSVQITGPGGSTVVSLGTSDTLTTHFETRNGPGTYEFALERISTAHIPVMGIIASFDHRPALFPGPPSE